MGKQSTWANFVSLFLRQQILLPGLSQLNIKYIPPYLRTREISRSDFRHFRKQSSPHRMESRVPLSSTTSKLSFQKSRCMTSMHLNFGTSFSNLCLFLLPSICCLTASFEASMQVTFEQPASHSLSASSEVPHPTYRMDASVEGMQVSNSDFRASKVSSQSKRSPGVFLYLSSQQTRFPQLLAINQIQSVTFDCHGLLGCQLCRYQPSGQPESIEAPNQDKNGQKGEDMLRIIEQIQGRSNPQPQILALSLILLHFLISLLDFRICLVVFRPEMESELQAELEAEPSHELPQSQSLARGKRKPSEQASNIFQHIRKGDSRLGDLKHRSWALMNSKSEVHVE